MGSTYGYQRPLPPCANCGRKGGGFMSSSAWGHNFMCCRDACGKRLAHKLKHGMGQPHAEPMFDGFAFGDPADRVLDLRIRIKQLSNLVKDAAPYLATLRKIS